MKTLSEIFPIVDKKKNQEKTFDQKVLHLMKIK